MKAAVAGVDEDRCSGSALPIKLPAASLLAWQIRDLVGFAVAVAVITGLSRIPALAGLPLAYHVLVYALLLTPSAIEMLVLNPRRHRHYALEVRPGQLVISQGSVFRQVITIPRDSVLNLRERRGPVLRRLGLTYVSVLTIADQHRIGPLDSEQSELIRRFVDGDTSHARS